jgi:hypothetical protein
LETFVSHSNILPEGSYQIRDSRALSAVFQEVIIQAIKNKQAWCCWTDDCGIWLITGEMSLPLSRLRGKPVLQVSFYGAEGQLKDTGFWAPGQQATWQRCTE